VKVKAVYHVMLTFKAKINTIPLALNMIIINQPTWTKCLFSSGV